LIVPSNSILIPRKVSTQEAFSHLQILLSRITFIHLPKWTNLKISKMPLDALLALIPIRKLNFTYRIATRIVFIILFSLISPRKRVKELLNFQEQKNLANYVKIIKGGNHYNKYLPLSLYFH